MPVWGKVLTPEQLNALVSYTLSASKAGGAGAGAQLFVQNCSACHGQFGEGGPNPSRPGDIISPISSAEFLKTRDDVTLRSIISQGQPDFGMSPFGTTNGGPLSDDEIDSIVAFIRSWQANPPVELPAVAATPAQPPLTGAQIYAGVCSRCHGANGEGGIGTALADPEFQASYDDKALFDMISQGRIASPMIGWSKILSPDQINQLVQFIRTLQPVAAKPTGTPSVAPSFSKQILPLLNDKCSFCHGTTNQLGGWDASSYQSVMTTGVHGPVVTPGNVNGSLLAQKVRGFQTSGNMMPPTGLMSDTDVRLILDWIATGAADN